jgi:hypothetical protein
MSSKAIGRRTAMASGTALATASLIRSREAHAAKALTVVLESEGLMQLSCSKFWEVDR